MRLLLGLITVSTTNPEPLNAFAALYEATMPEKLFATRPWVDPGVLRYYVLVHDLTTGPVDEYVSQLEALMSYAKSVYAAQMATFAGRYPSRLRRALWNALPQC